MTEEERLNLMIYGTSHPEIYKTARDEEIERLRAEIEKFYKQAEMNARLMTENASLRAENETLRRDVKVAVMGDSAELQDVKHENEKLKEALKKIEMLWFNDESGSRNSYDAHLIARAALNSDAIQESSNERPNGEI